MKKTVVIDALDSFEDDFEVEKLIERILFIQKVEDGLEDIKSGRVVDYVKVKQQFYDKWPK